jgi:hypothetical protein
LRRIEFWVLKSRKADQTINQQAPRFLRPHHPEVRGPKAEPRGSTRYVGAAGGCSHECRSGGASRIDYLSWRSRNGKPCGSYFEAARQRLPSDSQSVRLLNQRSLSDLRLHNCV